MNKETQSKSTYSDKPRYPVITQYEQQFKDDYKKILNITIKGIQSKIKKWTSTTKNDK